MASANSGMTAGTYALRGLDTYDEVNDTCEAKYYDSSTNLCLSPYYESNKQTLISAFGSNNCNSEYDGEDYKYLDCSVSGLSVYAYSYGCVNTYAGAWGCSVNDSGASGCGVAS
jgi:hypothetical protein